MIHTFMDEVMQQVQDQILTGAPLAQLVKRWPIDLADRVRSSLDVKSSQS